MTRKLYRPTQKVTDLNIKSSWVKSRGNNFNKKIKWVNSRVTNINRKLK